MARMGPEDGVLLRDTLLHLAHLEAFMDRVAKTLDCLPSYADSRPDGGNAHIITKLNGLVAEIELWRAGDIVTANAPREGSAVARTLHADVGQEVDNGL